MGQRMTAARKWLSLGLGVKRWLFLLLIGVTLLGLGLAYLLYDLYSSALSLSSVWRMLTLSFMPRWARPLAAITVGLALAGVAIFQFNRSLLSAFVAPGGSVVDTVYRHRQRQRGPKVVVLGGGNGLSSLLRGLKTYTNNITAIVTVADDGGSSGQLRRELGVLPPGDFRNCIAALADDEALTTQLFQYRFPSQRGEGSNGNRTLDGHSFGNLFITAMVSVTGSFERALIESGRVLAIRGQILPSTLENVTLCADLVGESAIQTVTGESAIPQLRQPIDRVYLDPADVPAYPPVLRAILEADLILAGPGSLFTSILPNLLVDDITRAIWAAPGRKMYICNVATQTGETEGFSVEDHVLAIERHTGRGLFPFVLANDNVCKSSPQEWNFNQVCLGSSLPDGYQLVAADLVDDEHPWRHNPEKLARAVMHWYEEEIRSQTER